MTEKQGRTHSKHIAEQTMEYLSEKQGLINDECVAEHIVGYMAEYMAEHMAEHIT